MLPSLSSRILALSGIGCGCLAVYLSQWGLAGVPRFAPMILSAVAVLSLFAMRIMPRYVVDDAELRAGVGDRPVNRLVLVQNIALAVLIPAIFGAIFVAPLFHDLGPRRGLLVGCAALLAASLAALAWVEARFRALIRRSGASLKMRR